MMKTLLALRHAKSSWKHPGLDDHERPLNKRGKRDAPLMGELLRTQELTPDVIVSSTAVRARQTAEKVAALCLYAGKIRLEDKLYLADFRTIIDVLRQVRDQAADRIMVVAHNPGLEQLVGTLTGEDEPFPTAALARIELPIERWTDLRVRTQGTLANFWGPKQLQR